MSADILLYKAEAVPVGKDQEQHVELARSIAKKFIKNSALPRLGRRAKFFPEPKLIMPKIRGKNNELNRPKKENVKNRRPEKLHFPFLIRPKTSRKK